MDTPFPLKRVGHSNGNGYFVDNQANNHSKEQQLLFTYWFPLGSPATSPSTTLPRKAFRSWETCYPYFYFIGVSKGTCSCSFLHNLLGYQIWKFFQTDLGGLSKTYSLTLQHLLSLEQQIILLIVLVYCTTITQYVWWGVCVWERFSIGIYIFH